MSGADTTGAGLGLAKSLCDAALQTVRRMASAEQLPAFSELESLAVVLERAHNEIADARSPRQAAAAHPALCVERDATGRREAAARMASVIALVQWVERARQSIALMRSAADIDPAVRSRVDAMGIELAPLEDEEHAGLIWLLSDSEALLRRVASAD